MSKFKNVVLASDFDGTLLNSKHEVSKENLEAINYFCDNGGTFVPATGRGKLAIKDYMDILPSHVNYTIVLNGALVYDFLKKKVKCTYSMPEEAPDMLLDLTARFPHVAAEIYVEDSVYTLNCNEVAVEHFDMINLPYIVCEFSQLPPVNEWLKINFAAQPEELVEVKEYLRANYSQTYSLVSSVSVFFEVTAPKANKGQAVKYLKKEYPDKDVHTIGDSFNDLTMIKEADISFAPANAEEEIKKNADVIVSSNNDHAVKEAIEYLDRIYK